MNIKNKSSNTKNIKSDYSPTYINDEDYTIDLLAMLKILWEKKILIILCTFVAGVGSLFYLFMQPHEYKTETVIVPFVDKESKVKDEIIIKILDEIKKNKIDKLVEIAKNLKSISSKQSNLYFNRVGARELLAPDRNMETDDNKIFYKLLKSINISNIEKIESNLVSSTMQNKFIKTNVLMELSALDRNMETDDKNMLSRLFNKLVVNKERISFVSNNHENAIKVINDYVKFIDSITSKHLMDSISRISAQEITQTKIDILAERKIINNRINNQIERRDYQIIQLEEAIMIASKLGINDYNMELFSNSKQNIQLYMRGTRTLLAELDVIRNRKHFLVSKVRLTKLLDKLNLLLTIKKVVPLISAAGFTVGSNSTKVTLNSKNYSIVLVITIIGLIIGIMLAFLIKIVKKVKSLENDENDN